MKYRFLVSIVTLCFGLCFYLLNVSSVNARNNLRCNEKACLSNNSKAALRSRSVKDKTSYEGSANNEKKPSHVGPTSRGCILHSEWCGR